MKLITLNNYMKLTLAITAFIVPLTATAKPIKLAASDFTSPIELTTKFYKLNNDGKNTLEESKAIRKDSFNSRWCMKKNADQNQLKKLLNELCTNSGGTMLDEKWCTSNDTLKFVAVVTAPRAKTFVTDMTPPLKCDEEEQIAVYIKEFPNGLSTSEPKLVACPRIEYPAASIRLNEQGQITLQLLVSVDGTVTNTKIESSTGYERLDWASTKQFSRCLAIPKIIDAKPIETWMQFKTNWELTDPKPPTSPAASAP
jgi:TonB family protein